MSKSRHARLVGRRERLWREDPHCRKCGVLTILPAEIARMTGLTLNSSEFSKLMPHELKEKMATLEHMVERWKGRRQSYQKPMTTLWCYKCNHTSGQVGHRAHVARQIEKRLAKQASERQLVVVEQPKPVWGPSPLAGLYAVWASFQAFLHKHQLIRQPSTADS